MMLKTPKFWQKKNLTVFLLLIFSAIYWLVFNFNKLQQKIFSKKAKIPIICVGNIIAGGSGKTPIAIAIGKILQKNKINFAYLSRGYLGKFNELQTLDENSNFNDVGDEALLLKEIAPTFVAKKRVFAACKISDDYDFQALILDDGMQNFSLQKDLTIMVIDGKIQFGNKFLIPAGPLRQSILSGLKISDLIVVIGKIDENLRKILQKQIEENKVFQAEIKSKNLDKFQNQKLFAFCGIAYPEKFFSYLQENGCEIVERKVFGDHYSYNNQDLKNLVEKANEINAKLITTKKDWIKFNSFYKEKIDFLEIEVEFLEEEKITSKILKILN